MPVVPASYFFPFLDFPEVNFHISVISQLAMFDYLTIYIYIHTYIYISVYLVGA